MLEVIRFNNEEGPVRIEVHTLKAKILALREMIKDKQILDDKNINDILDENEEKYKGAVSKTLGRLNLFG
jgi:chromosome condensin MukBEF ATPase and DNA-binding subunit MukB